MVGQKKLIDNFNYLLDNSTMPSFTILSGNKGCGKKTLVHEVIAPKINLTIYEVPDVKVSTIRDMLEDIYTKGHKIYLIPNAEDMSLQAVNSILKTVEEVPRGCYIILTVNDSHALLGTVRSRAQIFNFSPYSRDELLQFVSEGCKYHDEILAICDTPGECKTFCEDPYLDKFFKFVDTTVCNIDTVSEANVLKIATYLKFKDSQDGFEPVKFLKAFVSSCYNKAIASSDLKWVRWIIITTEAITKLSVNGVNKLSVVDNWIFRLREEL